MNDLKIFISDEFGEIRTIEVDGKPYFVGVDIARALGYSNPSKAIIQHCKGITKLGIPSKGGNQETNCIPEGDLYRLIVHSELESAERFETWVFDEVLPSIRKNGGYIAGQESLSDEELLSKALMVAQRKIEEKNQLIAMQDRRIQQMKPKEIFADAVSASDSSMLVRDLAKIIKQNGVPIGEKRFYKWMRENGYICKGSTSPTQKAMELGLFEVIIRTVERGNGLPLETKTTKVTGKGQQYFINKFLNKEERSA